MSKSYIQKPMTDNFKQVFFQMNVANMLHSKASRQDITLFISVQRTGTYSLQKKKKIPEWLISYYKSLEDI